MTRRIVTTSVSSPPSCNQRRSPDPRGPARRGQPDAVLPTPMRAAGRTCTRWTPPANGMLPMEIGTIVVVCRRHFDPCDVGPPLPPAARFFLLKGPFDGLPGAWETLFAWCTQEKLTPAGINWEIYSNWQGVDPAKIETELYALLA